MNIFEQVQAFNQALSKYRAPRNLQAQEAFERGMKYFERYLNDRDSEYELTETFSHFLDVIEHNSKDIRGFLALSNLFIAVGDYSLAQIYLDSVNPKHNEKTSRALADTQAVTLWEQAQEVLSEQNALQKSSLNRFNYPYLYHPFRDFFHRQVEMLTSRRIPDPSPRTSTVDLLKSLLTDYSVKDQFFQNQIALFQNRMDLSGLKASPNFLAPYLDKIRQNLSASRDLELLQKTIYYQTKQLQQIQTKLHQLKTVTPALEKKMLLLIQGYEEIVADLKRLLKKKYPLAELELPYQALLTEIQALLKWSHKLRPLSHPNLRNFQGQSLAHLSRQIKGGN